MKQLLYLFIFTVTFLFTACESSIERENIRIEEENLNGDWKVQAYINNEYIYGPFNIKTQTLSDKEIISIKDEGEFWNFQAKAAYNKSNNTFISQLSVNEISQVGAKIKILNGELIGKDSISFNIQFEDDIIPYGIIYNIKGKRAL